MALQQMLGLELFQKNKVEEYKELSKLEALQYDEMKDDGAIKSMIPKLCANDNVKLPRVVDEFTRHEITMKFNKGTTTASFIYKNGIVVCVDSRATGGQFIASGSVRKVLHINRYLLGTMAGGAADCSYWIRVLSERCRLYELRNRETISVAAASKLLANMVYNYKGMGISLGSMICGYDQKKGPMIYMVDNDARRLRGTMFSVGSGSVYAYGVLDKGYHFDMEDEEAFDLGRRAIYHAAHRDSYSGNIIRIYVIKKDGWKIISEDDFSVLHDRYTNEKSVSLNH